MPFAGYRLVAIARHGMPPWVHQGGARTSGSSAEFQGLAVQVDSIKPRIESAKVSTSMASVFGTIR